MSFNISWIASADIPLVELEQRVHLRRTGRACPDLDFDAEVRSLDIVKLAPLLILLVLSACSREDKLREQLTGTWTRDDTFQMTLAADGSFVSQWTLPTKSLTYKGTWKVQDGAVVSTITNSIARGTTNFQAAGTVDRWVIVKVAGDDLVWSNAEQTISLKRKR